MKTLKIFLISYFGIFSLIHAQNKNSTNYVSPNLGLGIPQTDLRNVAEKSLDFGVSFDKIYSNKFGLGLDLNYQKSPYTDPTIYSKIPSYASVSSGKGDISNINLAFGPGYKLGNGKFNALFYFKGILSISKSSNISKQLEVDLGTSSTTIPILNIPDKSQTSFGMTNGAKLNFKINDKVAFFVNPQILYFGTTIDYTSKDIEQAFYSDNGVDIFNWESLIDCPFQEISLRPVIFNGSSGVSIKLDGN